MSNVIDDVLLSATKTANGVVIEISIETFRQLITSLKYSSGAWIASDETPDEAADSASKPEPEQQPKQTVSEPVPYRRSDASENTKRYVVDDDSNGKPRSPNQEVTAAKARELFEFAMKHPEMTKPELQRAVGLHPYTCYNKNHQFDIFGDGQLRSLNQLIELGRELGENGFDRFSGDVFDAEAVRQMGISSRFHRKN